MELSEPIVVPKDKDIDSIQARVDLPFRVMFGEGVEDYFHEKALEVDNMQDSMSKTMRNRTVVNAKKKAMIRAVINNPKSPVITMEYATWAYGLAEYFDDYKVKVFRDCVFESPLDKAIQIAVRKIKDGKGKWVRRSGNGGISGDRAIRSLGTKGQRDDVFRTILSDWQGVIECNKSINDSEGKPIKGPQPELYRYIGKAEKL